LEETFMCGPSFLECARLMICVRAHAHSLEGTLLAYVQGNGCRHIIYQPKLRFIPDFYAHTLRIV